MSRVAIMLRFAIWSIVLVTTSSYSLTLFGHRAAAPVARRARSNLMPLDDWIVEDCILAANNEDEVQDCMNIMDEIDDVRAGRIALADSPLTHAPHTLEDITGDWDRAYTRDQAAYPMPWNRQFKFWPAVGRVDNVHGDRHLVCSCAPLESYRESIGVGTIDAGTDHG